MIKRLRHVAATCLLLAACGAPQRPPALVKADAALGNQDAARKAGAAAPGVFSEARALYSQANAAFDEGELEEADRIAELATVCFDTAIETWRTQEAEKRIVAAAEREAKAVAAAEGEQRRLGELDRQVERLQKLVAMQSDHAETEAERTKLAAEIRAAKEAADAAREEFEGKKKEMDVLAERKALFDEANGLGAGYVRQEERGIVITLQETFAPGKNILLDPAIPVVDRIGQLAQKYATYRLVVEGYTDNRGADATNLALSASRAQAVEARLVSEGKIDFNRIKSAGYGEEKPIGDNSTADGRAKNRRVEVVFLFR